MILQLTVPTSGRGLHEITEDLQGKFRSTGVGQGLCTLFVQHTSASLVVQENADPSAKTDLERWLDRLVPDGDPLFTHTAEGRDDMPSHVRAALTLTSLSIPIHQGRLQLGTWQGVYLWEHRLRGSKRSVSLHILSD